MGSSANGWIKLSRKLLDHWLFQDPERFRAWIDILLSVNAKPAEVLVAGHVIHLKPGQKWTSVRELAERWGWGRDRVTRFIRLLSDEGMMTADRTPNGTLLTVVKWGFYQGGPDTKSDTNKDTDKDTGKDTDKAQTRKRRSKEGKNARAGAVTGTAAPLPEEHGEPLPDDWWEDGDNGNI